jgi:hypothetical protein
MIVNACCRSGGQSGQGPARKPSTQHTRVYQTYMHTSTLATPLNNSSCSNNRYCWEAAGAMNGAGLAGSDWAGRQCASSA